jgi:predicted nucleic acid-binding protein
MDLLLSAQAKSKKLTLVTNIIRKVERIDGLRIENWVWVSPNTER